MSKIPVDSLKKGDPVLDRVTARIIPGFESSSLVPEAEREVDPRGYRSDISWDYLRDNHIQLNYLPDIQRHYCVEGLSLEEMRNPDALRPVTVYFQEQ